jgi:hypothetical protein
MTGARAANGDVERALDLLLPRPRRIAASEGMYALPRSPRLFLAQDESLRADASRFRARIREFGLAIELADECPEEADFRLAIDRAIVAEQGYRLSISRRGVDLVAADEAGAWYALCTLEQLVRSAGPAGSSAERRLACAEIEDAPDFAARGLMLDVSRSKVPTLATLRSIVDLCSRLKLNQLQLYTEHTFAYAGHERVWRDASPITAEDLRELDPFCRERHVELVPNQQSFGHMHRWLKHEPYRALAEVPEGIDHAFSREREPFGLCPIDPGSLLLLEDLYDQLLPHFSSRMFNVGLDETIDLGLGRSREACARRGKEHVYLDFVRAVHERVSERGKRMQFWGDIIVERPELLSELPRDAIALEWGYEAAHPFAEHARRFAESGLEFYVCPGTSSWQSIAGRTRNALANLRSAAEHGRRAGAHGYLVTDWGDRGHLQPLSASYVGIAAGAQRAWNALAEDEPEWPRLLDAHVFDETARGLGRIACELGDAYLETGSNSTNGSALFFLLAFADEPLPHARMPDLTIDGLARALEHSSARRAQIETLRSRPGPSSIDLDEMAWAADVLAFACRLGMARSNAIAGAPLGAIEARARQDLAAELEPLIAEHRQLWSARNRSGGLDESASWLLRIATALQDGA